MTKGSWIHEDVTRHFESCTQCRDVRAEEMRVQQPKALRRMVPDAVLAAMCPGGRAIYRSYLRWLAEPDE
jgi:hypothetical protein